MSKKVKKNLLTDAPPFTYVIPWHKAKTRKTKGFKKYLPIKQKISFKKFKKDINYHLSDKEKK